MHPATLTNEGEPEVTGAALGPYELKAGPSAASGVGPRHTQGRLGIVAGAGSLPAAVAEAAKSAGHEVFIAAFARIASPDIERFPHAYVRLGQIGRLFALLRQNDCRNVVLLGALRRPPLFGVRLDAGALMRITKILRLFKGGDDSVLRRVARLFESEGFCVRGAHEFAPRLLAPEGAFSASLPDEQSLRDVALGLKVVGALGAFDIGQAAVVARGYVLGVEAAEGTDGLLRRCAGLNKWGLSGRHGVLVKAPKPGQDLRLDMPAIGPTTVELAAEAGLRGIAVAAGQVLLADQDELMEKAEKLKLFLYGVTWAGATAPHAGPSKHPGDEV